MKKWYQSKTYWFNISIAIIGMLEASMHLLQDSLGSNYGFAFIAISAIGIVLRNVTTTEIEKKDV